MFFATTQVPKHAGKELFIPFVQLISLLNYSFSKKNNKHLKI
jgi:hypothetical protein